MFFGRVLAEIDLNMHHFCKRKKNLNNYPNRSPLFHLSFLDSYTQILRHESPGPPRASDKKAVFSKYEFKIKLVIYICGGGVTQLIEAPG